jgi:hypothetical protein
VKNVELIPLPNAAGQIPHHEEEANSKNQIPKLNDFGSWFLVLGSWLWVQWPHGSPATEEEPNSKNQIPKLNDFGSWFLVLGSWFRVPDAHASTPQIGQ